MRRQYEQTQGLSQVKSQPQLKCCCVSSDEEVSGELLRRTNQVNIPYQQTLANIQKKLSPSKFYKINSNPIYPLSSSSDEESSFEEVMVAAQY